MEVKSFYIVRFSDCDPLGHLNNSKYIDYMLNAREDHLRENYQLTIEKFHQQGKGWVVANHEIFYIKPAYYNEEVCITSSLMEAGPSHLWVEMAIYNKERTKLKSIMWTRFISIDIKTGKKDDHSADFMEFALPIVNKDIDFNAGIKNRIGVLLGK